MLDGGQDTHTHTHTHTQGWTGGRVAAKHDAGINMDGWTTAYALLCSHMDRMDGRMDSPSSTSARHHVDGRMDGWMDRWRVLNVGEVLYGWMDGWIERKIDQYMDRRID